MPLFPAELVTAAIDDLPPLQRSLIRESFLEGESIYALMKRHDMKRAQIESTIEAGIALMRTALRSRGVVSIADVI